MNFQIVASRSHSILSTHSINLAIESIGLTLIFKTIVSNV